MKIFIKVMRDKILKILKRLKNLFFYIILLEVVLFLCNILPNLKLSNIIRGFLIRPFFEKCGKGFQVAKGVRFIQSRKITIGNNVYIAHNCWINGVGEINIGDGVILSPMVVLATSKHKYVNGHVSNSESEIGKIVIGKGTWIASNSVITKDVTIGSGSIIGACSSVTKDIPKYTFAGGVPAKVIKKLYSNE